MRIMYDATTIENIPLHGATMIGCYTDGSFTNVTAAAQRFPDCQILTYDVNGSNPHARALDYEPGDVQNPETAAGWVQKSRFLGNEWPTVYVDRSEMVDVMRACAVAGLVLGKDWWLGVTTLDMTWKQFQGVTGVAFVQYQNFENLYDVSVVLDDDWFPAAPAKPTGIPGGFLVNPLSTVCQVNLAWNPLEGHVQYKLQLERQSATGEWVLTQSATTDDLTTYTFREMAARSRYRVRVSGGNWTGWSEFTTPLSKRYLQCARRLVSL